MCITVCGGAGSGTRRLVERTAPAADVCPDATRGVEQVVRRRVVHDRAHLGDCHPRPDLRKERWHPKEAGLAASYR